MNDEQILDLARSLSSMNDALDAFYADPKNQKAFDEWMSKRKETDE